MMQWIIADVHGCIRTLESLIKRIQTADESPKFIFLGDYVDRGPNSKEVVQFVYDMYKNGAVCLRGNHDDVVDWLLNDHSYTNMAEYVCGRPCIDSVVRWWLNNGFGPTVTSYGSDLLPETAGPYAGQYWGGVIERWREMVPDHHKEFIKNLPVFWEGKDHFACHGYFSPNQEAKNLKDIRLSYENSHYALWERFGRNPSNKTFIPVSEFNWDKIGIFGHTPVQYYQAEAPIKYELIRLIDCWACNNGYLTGYNCESDDWILEATDKGDIIS